MITTRRAEMPYPRNRLAYKMYEARNANRLFRAPGAFAFRPPWSKDRADTRYLRRATRHTRVVREVAAAKRFFAKKSAFRFRPKWRAKSRKSSKGLLYARERKKHYALLKKYNLPFRKF